MSLTGRTRYRTGWFGWIILQVEEIDRRYRDEGEAIWRDAKAVDFTPADTRAIFRDAPMPYPGQVPVSGYQPIGDCNPNARPPTER
jgi:hypothetical protein